MQDANDKSPIARLAEALAVWHAASPTEQEGCWSKVLDELRKRAIGCIKRLRIEHEVTANDLVNEHFSTGTRGCDKQTYYGDMIGDKSAMDVARYISTSLRRAATEIRAHIDPEGATAYAAVRHACSDPNITNMLRGSNLLIGTAPRDDATPTDIVPSKLRDSLAKVSGSDPKAAWHYRTGKHAAPHLARHLLAVDACWQTEGMSALVSTQTIVAAVRELMVVGWHQSAEAAAEKQQHKQEPTPSWPYLDLFRHQPHGAVLFHRILSSLGQDLEKKRLPGMSKQTAVLYVLRPSRRERLQAIKDRWQFAGTPLDPIEISTVVKKSAAYADRKLLGDFLALCILELMDEGEWQ